MTLFVGAACHRAPPSNSEPSCQCLCPDGGVVVEHAQPDGGCREECIEARQVDCGFGR